MDTSGFRVRLRVRLSKSFTTTVMSRTLAVGAREVTISAPEKEKSLEDATWIVLRAGGFATEQQAQDYGKQLKVITELAGLCDRLGIDVGLDKPTSMMTHEFARMLGLADADDRVLPNVHGIMVIPDDDKNKIPVMNFTGKVTASLDQFSETLIELGNQWSFKIPGAANGVRLLNLALMTSEPIAQVALAISAVEELGQGEKWSPAQEALIDELATKLETDPTANAETLEVAQALRRNLHKIGLRQGVRRVLDRIGLNHLLKEWDRVYSLRSAVFHGTGDLASIDLGTLATDAVTLCGTIMLMAAKHDGCILPKAASVHFPGLAELHNGD